MTTAGLKYVSADDWVVLYHVNGSHPEGKKIWEGHDCDSNAIHAIGEEFGAPVEFFKFTDEDEIDGETPDTFKSIKGIKKY